MALEASSVEKASSVNKASSVEKAPGVEKASGVKKAPGVKKASGVKKAPGVKKASRVEKASRVKSGKISRVLATELFLLYQRWGEERNLATRKTTPCAFGWDLRMLKMELDRLDPAQEVFVKRKERPGHVYVVDWAGLETHLRRTKRWGAFASA